MLDDGLYCPSPDLTKMIFVVTSVCHGEGINARNVY